MALYQGRRTKRGVEVKRDGLPFSPELSQCLYNHSPDGFEWGHEGSGPAQLALALLLDSVEHEEAAAKYHQTFKRDVIAKLPKTDWAMTSEGVRAWLGQLLVAELVWK